MVALRWFAFSAFVDAFATFAVTRFFFYHFGQDFNFILYAGCWGIQAVP